MPEQNYHGLVQNILNFENFSGDLVGLLPSGARLPQRAWLAPTLVNREPQIDAILEQMNTISSGGGGKLLVVVRGIRPDVHQCLVLRCGLVHFHEYYDLQHGWNFLGRIPWPRGATSVAAVLRKIGDALAFPKTARDQTGMEDELRKLPKSICFSHHVDGRSWKESDGALVLDWANYVTKSWPASGAGRLVVGFLCLDSGTDGKDPFAELIGKLKEIGAAASASILITKPLDLISDYHIDDWASEVGRFLRVPSIEAALLDAADALLSPTRQPVRLGDIYKPLCEKLAAVLPSGPIFMSER